jgi:putative chitinase
MDLATFRAAVGDASGDEVLLAAITAAWQRWGIDSGARQAAFLAQAGHETQGFTRLEEDFGWADTASILDCCRPALAASPYMADAAPEAKAAALAAAVGGADRRQIASVLFGGRLGNASWPSDDGWRFRRRGFLPIEGRDAYGLAARKIGVDLLAEPDRLAEPGIAAEAAGWLWAWRRLNELADSGTRADFDRIAFVLDPAGRGLEDRAARWDRARMALMVQA